VNAGSTHSRESEFKLKPSKHGYRFSVILTLTQYKKDITGTKQLDIAKIYKITFQIYTNY